VDKATSGSLVLADNVTVTEDLTMTVANKATLVVSAGKRLTFKNGYFNNDPVSLVSTSAGTASIGTITGTATNATNFTVERYIPATRKWRAISSPLSSATPGNTIYNTWQNNGFEESGTGVLLWTPSGGSGFASNSNSGAGTNIRGYTGGVGFNTPISTQDSYIISGSKPVPYLVFITDSYKASGGNLVSGASVTTIKATGTLYTGNYNSGSLIAGFHMLPNPYPSAITLSSSILSSVNDKFWVWDPKLSGFSGYGGYVATTLGVSNLTVGSYGGNSSRVIPAGAAFWVKSDGGSDAVNLTESAKSSGDFNVFGRLTNTNEVFRVNLMNVAQDQLYDGVAVVFREDGDATVNQTDAEKFGIGSDNISIRRSNQSLSIEVRPLITKNDTVYLRLHQMKVQRYSFIISTEQFDLSYGLTAVLEDMYLKREIPLNLSTNNTVEFEVDGNAASTGDRFRVVFRQSAVTSVAELDQFKRIRLYPNPLKKGSVLQLSFSNQPAGRYQLRIFDILGVQVWTQSVQHGGGTSVQTVSMPSSCSSGMYIVELISEKGLVQKQKINIQ
jgi:hypothetical protein